MQGGFTKGLIVGSMIGASMSMVMNPDMKKSKSRRRMMKTGRNMLRKSGRILVDVVDLIR